MTALFDGAADLRSGKSLWLALDTLGEMQGVQPKPGQVFTADVAIIGAGITGAFLAERMTREGKSVVLIDRREPQKGSTAASTAMLLWELDAPLLELEDSLGFEATTKICAASRRAVGDIGALVEAHRIDCSFRPRLSTYLSGPKLPPEQMREEHKLRMAIGATGVLVDEERLMRMGIVGDCALVSPGSAEADPVKLARGLLDVARARGALVLAPVVATDYEMTAQGVEIATGEGALVKAGALLLATGYEMPAFVPAPAHKVKSTWAAAGDAPLGAKVESLIWEANDPYLYLRAAEGGRVVMGGEDEAITDGRERERLTGAKVRKLVRKVIQLMPSLEGFAPEFVWSGLFGESEDALPFIGPVPGYARCFAAFGYGGNGITFSAIAADMLADELGGRKGETAAFFALDR